ncbi:MAG: SEL1-like repeat protein [Victivallales bacterium]|nr:SEL1-like repeat protein [Victivallales bacterium]
MLGCCYANGDGVTKDMKKAVKWLQKAAEKGHPEALEMLRSLNP